MTAFDQRLPRGFYAKVHAAVAQRLRDADLSAGLFDDPDDVAYLTGFFHHACERPVAVFVAADAAADTVLLVPELEREHAEAQHAAAEIVTYPEYPGLTEPFTFLARQVPAPRRLGVSAASSRARTELWQQTWPDAAIVDTTAVATERLVKHPEELVLHQEAARITDEMLTAGVAAVTDAVAAGGELPSEAELARLVSSVGTSLMYGGHANVVVVSLLAGGLVYSGANSARPHGLPSAHRLTPGEPFMLSLGCAVGGRYVEGERTFILGTPTPEHERYYTAVLAAQLTGVDSLRPGLTCAAANKLCLDVIRDAGLEQYLRHRQGHGIGIGMHEPPWLEDGDETELQEGFVVSNEPGVYVPGHGGYRVSDSMLVTADGARPLTAYPKSLDDIVVGC